MVSIEIPTIKPVDDFRVNKRQTIHGSSGISEHFASEDVVQSKDAGRRECLSSVIFKHSIRILKSFRLCRT